MTTYHTNTCIAALLATFVLLVVQVLQHVTDFGSMAVSGSSPWYTCFTYHFFHTGYMHLLCNCWCLLSISFVCSVTIGTILSSFAIASTYGLIYHLIGAHTPVIGLSGMLYACFGIILSKSLSRNRQSSDYDQPTLHLLYAFLLWFSLSFIPTFFFPGVSALTHICCFLASVILYLPIFNNKKHDHQHL